MSWTSNPKKMFDEENHTRALNYKRRRDELIHHPSFLGFLKEEATYGDWTDYERLWRYIEILFKSAFTDKYSISILLKIEDKIAEERLRWKEQRRLNL
tara:strand:- start:1570 stop:1863 length:294 start_codon:yes stop_codon:yes gene_type:complete